MEIIELVIHLFPARIRRTEKLPPPPPTAMITRARGIGIARKVIHSIAIVDPANGLFWWMEWMEVEATITAPFKSISIVIYDELCEFSEIIIIIITVS